MTMRWSPLEVDVLHGLEDLSRAPGRRIIIPPAGYEDEESLIGLLLREARGFYETERDVEIRRITELERKASGSFMPELDPRTSRKRRAPAPSQDILTRVRSTNERRIGYEAALAQLALPAASDNAREILRRYELRPRSELAALKPQREPGELVEILADGWSLRPTLAERLAGRREMQGLPAGRDWLD